MYKWKLEGETKIYVVAENKLLSLESRIPYEYFTGTYIHIYPDAVSPWPPPQGRKLLGYAEEEGGEGGGGRGESGKPTFTPLKKQNEKKGKETTRWSPVGAQFFWGAPLFCSWNAPSAGLGGPKVWALGARYPGVQRRARCLRGSEVVLKKTARSPDWICMNEGSQKHIILIGL